MPTKIVALPSLEYLEECFEIDFENGVVVWRSRPLNHFRNIKGYSVFQGRLAGTVAGSFHKKTGYINVGLLGNTYRLHRIIYKMFTRTEIPKEQEIDHKDGNRINNAITNLTLKIGEKNARNKGMNTRNTSGISGVQFFDNGKNIYWQASWTTLKRKKRSKYFSIYKLGDAEAFRLACEHRAKMIEELNSQGAGYTDRHGT